MQENASPAQPHRQDADCTLDPTDTCSGCGVHHGDPCASCEGRGYHRRGCPESGLYAGRERVAGAVTSHPHPATIMRAALAAADARYLRVELDEQHGVARIAHSQPRWVQDPRTPSISPLGAVLLYRQPRAATVLEGVAEVFDTPIAYVKGWLCGATHMQPEGAEVRGRDVRFYLMGIEHGARFRLDWMSLRCERHQRSYRRGTSCPGCVRDGVC
jgi:hypothetical protein